MFFRTFPQWSSAPPSEVPALRPLKRQGKWKEEKTKKTNLSVMKGRRTPFRSGLPAGSQLRISFASHAGGGTPSERASYRRPAHLSRKKQRNPGPPIGGATRRRVGGNPMQKIASGRSLSWVSCGVFCELQSFFSTSAYSIWPARTSRFLYQLAPGARPDDGKPNWGGPRHHLNSYIPLAKYELDKKNPTEERCAQNMRPRIAANV